MAERKSYSLSDLVTQCDPSAPMPEALREWLLVFTVKSLLKDLLFLASPAWPPHVLTGQIATTPKPRQ